MTIDRTDRIVATLLGMAVGDALGVPREGLPPQRARRLFGAGPLTHRFLFGRGMVSDETEHAAMTVQALLVAGGDETAFVRSLAWRLRGWLVALPAAIGWGTLRATVRLWLGFSPRRSGVDSAGNGPLMRAPILGAVLADDPERLAAFVRASTHITHRDPRAEEAALVLALCARHAVLGGAADVERLFDELRPHLRDPAFAGQLEQVQRCLAAGASPAELSAALGWQNGVSGFAPHTACAALFCWLRYPRFDQALEAAILMGGDADSTGAAVGALAGAALGTAAIPRPWREGLLEWPRSPAWLERLGRAAAQLPARRWSVPLFWPALPVRNVFFGLVAIGHVLRRLLPPY